jgi:agmatinase
MENGKTRSLVMTREEKIKAFDPNSIGNTNEGIFGLPFSIEESAVVLVPVPWEVTVSYGGGTADAPQAIFDAAFQVDLFDPVVPDAWKKGIAMDDADDEIRSKSEALRQLAEAHIDDLANGKKGLPENLEKVKAGCLWLNEKVRQRVRHFLDQGKTVGLVGGDHSTPLGMMQALADKYQSFGILQIDAHADLRNAYEGFEFSHASIMFNALKLKAVSKLVQVGIRDYCEEELNIMNAPGQRVQTFFDRDMRHAQYRADSWDAICNRIVEALPQDIYLSFDIDGLDPKLCPSTGTPVAGGLEAEQVLFLIEKIVLSGRRFIAFDLNEVGTSQGEWDANVAARLLYRICNLVALSQKK